MSEQNLNKSDLDNLVKTIDEFNFSPSNISFHGYNDSSSITFFQNKIKINGDPVKALQYIIEYCFILYKDSRDRLCQNTLTIADNLCIDLDHLIIYGNYLGPEFEIIKNVIEQEVFKKIKMKAFW